MTIARNVLTSDTASAPAFSDARANEATSVTFARELGMTGSRVTFRTALTTFKGPGGTHPKVMPPSLMFGHEMFSSIAATPSGVRENPWTSKYSSSVVPQMLTMTVVPRARARAASRR